MKNTSKTSENTSSNASGALSATTISIACKPLRKRVWVGMSGGVDSAVSAALLKDAGHDVTGVFIKVWQPDTTDCGWKDERRDAMRVAAQLDIPFLTFDFSEKYKKEVVDYMIEEYRCGRTPNPDIMCNRHVKFGSFLDEAKREGIDYVATGHYAQNVINKKTGMYSLIEGADDNKDQSYFLWTLGQEDLSHILFPVGHLQKSEVRRLARKYKLPVCEKKDSQGVCFIGHLDMKQFLKECVTTEKGDVLDILGAVVGQHDGAVLYTIGERHGFTMCNNTPATEAHFVVSKNIETNTITVAPLSTINDHSGDISPRSAHVNMLSWVKNPAIPGQVYSARIRYRQEKQLCTITYNHEGTKKCAEVQRSGGMLTVTFDNSQKGMAEGQSVVFYDGTTCIGGGILAA